MDDAATRRIFLKLSRYRRYGTVYLCGLGPRPRPGGLFGGEALLGRLSLLPAPVVRRDGRSVVSSISFTTGNRTYRFSVSSNRKYNTLKCARIFHTVVNRWNSLDQETVDMGSINSFKGRLDKIRKRRMGFFMDSAWSAKP